MIKRASADRATRRLRVAVGGMLAGALLACIAHSGNDATRYRQSSRSMTMCMYGPNHRDYRRRRISHGICRRSNSQRRQVSLGHPVSRGEEPNVLSSKKNIHVVLDTTAVRPDLLFTRESHKRLISLSAHNAIRLYIPEVVLREMCRHYDRDTLSPTKAFIDGLAGLRRLGVMLPDIPDPASIREAVDSIAARYASSLREYLDEHSVKILPLPTVSHEKLLVDDLANKKPWKEGKGYRDALIWHTLLDLLSRTQEADQIIFVTANTSDFADSSKNQLANTLREEASHFEREVLMAKDIGAALVLVTPENNLDYPPAPSIRLELLPRLSVTAPETPNMRIAVLDAVQATMDKITGSSIDDQLDERSSGLSFGEVNIPPELQNPTLYNVDARMEDAELDEYEDYGDDLILLHVTVPAGVTIDGYAHKSDTYGDTLEIMEFDWNDHMSWVYIEREVRLIFSVLYARDGTVEDVEFTGAEPIFSRPPNPDSLF